MPRPERALTEPVTIQQATETRDRRGGVIRTWTDLPGTPHYAAITTPDRSGEEFHAPQLRYVRRRDLTIRYDDQVTVACRVVYAAQDWDVLDIAETGRRQFVTLAISTGLRE